MANIYWNKEKVSKEEIFAELMKKLPYITDSAFTVRFEDSIAVCVAERHEKDVSPYKEGHWDIVPPRVLGWRVIKKIVPKGYIDVFYYDPQ
tara:strand:+ start:182 stop:454 length:273 start_codon:yes stop_codon:yes gene_type:complete